MILFYKNGLARAAHRPGDRTTCRARRTRTGFYPLQHGFTSWRKATPAAGATTASEQVQEQSSNALKWIGIAVAVVVVIGADRVPDARRRTASERE